MPRQWGDKKVEGDGVARVSFALPDLETRELLALAAASTGAQSVSAFARAAVLRAVEEALEEKPEPME